MDAVDPQKRHWSRRLVLQALYQWQLAGHSIDELLAQYSVDESWDKVDKDYFVELLNESIKNEHELTAIFENYSDTSAEAIDPVEKAILLFSTYEILNRSDIPSDVVITEAVKLCKKFGSVEGYKFINGILDKIAKLRVI